MSNGRRVVEIALWSLGVSVVGVAGLSSLSTFFGSGW